MKARLYATIDNIVNGADYNTRTPAPAELCINGVHVAVSHQDDDFKGLHRDFLILGPCDKSCEFELEDHLGKEMANDMEKKLQEYLSEKGGD